MLLDAVPVEHALIYFWGLAREQVGRSLLDGLSLHLRIEISGSNLSRLKPSKFWISSEIAGFESGSRRGKSEHCRAASPLTAGRLMNLRFEIFRTQISDSRSQNRDRNLRLKSEI